jgi:hypothetical protein
MKGRKDRQTGRQAGRMGGGEMVVVIIVMVRDGGGDSDSDSDGGR